MSSKNFRFVWFSFISHHRSGEFDLHSKTNTGSRPDQAQRRSGIASLSTQKKTTHHRATENLLSHLRAFVVHLFP
jgi:hypothetical protein